MEQVKEVEPIKAEPTLVKYRVGLDGVIRSEDDKRYPAGMAIVKKAIALNQEVLLTGYFGEHNLMDLSFDQIGMLMTRIRRREVCFILNFMFVSVERAAMRLGPGNLSLMNYARLMGGQF